MAKKRTPRKPQAEPKGKVPFQVRFDAELHQRLKAEAEAAGCSLNDLVQGICWGVVENLHQGEAKILTSGFVQTVDRKKCLFAGRPGHHMSPNEREDYERHFGEDVGENDSGVLWFGLDFTGRGVVRG